MKYLYFTSEYCIPCKTLKPKISKHPEITIIDVDKNGKYVKRYDILSIPTLLILNENETVEKQITGTRINKFLKENFEE